jgi:hypothetical protein
MKISEIPLRSVVLLAAVGMPTFIWSQTQPATVAEVHRLYLADNEDRGGDGSRYSHPIEEVNKRDEQRRARVRVLLANGSLTTAQDFHDAAFIFQHGQGADDYLLAHILAVEAVVKGDASSKWISAATLDRYLQHIGQRQVFGTQYSNKRSLPFPSPQQKNDSQETGMTQQPYNQMLMPDTLRLDFCVPGIEQQKENLQEFEKGSYPKGIIPAGCTR